MQESELIELITKIKERKTETSKIEFKSAKGGVPEKLYDSFSSFSNTEGGVILFGIDEKAGYKVCGIQNLPDGQPSPVTDICKSFLRGDMHSMTPAPKTRKTEQPGLLC